MADIQTFMVQADRLHFMWRAAESGVDLKESPYQPVDPLNVFTAYTQAGEPVIAFTGPGSHPDIPTLKVARRYGFWAAEEEDLGLFNYGEITV